MIFMIAWGLIALDLLIAWWLAYVHGRRAAPGEEPVSGPVQNPFVSVLIPAWCERNVLKATLEALRGTLYPDWEVIIIAGGADDTEEYARTLCMDWKNYTVIPQPPLGKNAALNLGLQRAKGQIIVILDADTQVEPNWLEQLIVPLTRGYDAATGNYFPLASSWVTSYFEMEKISAYLVHGDKTLNGCGGIAIKRDALDRLGGFPQNVTVGVDWDLDMRLQSAGAERTFAWNARSRTALSSTPGQFWKNQVRWRRAHLRSVIDNRRGTALLVYGIAAAFYVIPIVAMGLNIVLPGSWQLWPLFWTWLLLRRCNLPIEVAARCGSHWLRWAWVPVALLPVDFLAGLVALATIRRKVVFFKGPRPGGAL